MKEEIKRIEKGKEREMLSKETIKEIESKLSKEAIYNIAGDSDRLINSTCGRYKLYFYRATSTIHPDYCCGPLFELERIKSIWLPNYLLYRYVGDSPNEKGCGMLIRLDYWPTMSEDSQWFIERYKKSNWELVTEMELSK